MWGGGGRLFLALPHRIANSASGKRASAVLQEAASGAEGGAELREGCLPSRPSTVTPSFIKLKKPPATWERSPLARTHSKQPVSPYLTPQSKRNPPPPVSREAPLLHPPPKTGQKLLLPFSALPVSRAESEGREA